MEPEPAVLIPSLVSFILILISSLLMYITYSRTKFREILWITIGLAFSSIVPFSFVMFSYIEGGSDNIDQLRGNIGFSSLILTQVGLLIIAGVFLQLSWEKIRFRHIVLFALTTFSSGLLPLSYEATFDTAVEAWKIVYNPPITLALVGLTTLWIGLELIRISWVTYRIAPKNKNLPQLFIVLAWVFNLFGAIIIVIERNVLLSSTSTFYLISAAIGFGLLATAILMDPLCIVRQNIGARYLILSNRETGVTLYSYPFIDEAETEYGKSEDILFSSALQGVLTMLSEITGQSDLPPNIGYANFNIMLEESDTYICYLMCLFDVRPARNIMQDLLSKMSEVANGLTEYISDDLEERIDKTIESKLYFVK